MGEWDYDNKHGQGTYIFANGDKYVGEWKDDKRHGLGSFITADGQRFTGIWEDGSFKGDAQIRSPTPHVNGLEVPADETK